MKPILFIICVFSSLELTKTQKGDTDNDLIAAYYTTTVASTETIIKQDKDDAKAIWDSNQREDVIASILMYRDKPRRYAITQKIMEILGTDSWLRQKRYWIYPKRYVQAEARYNSTWTFRDLVYSLTYDESLVLSQYMENFFSRKDETWIIIGMVLAKDMSNMINFYDDNHGSSFADERNSQRKPFKFMLRAWVRHPREGIEYDNLDSKLIMDDAELLKTEYEKGSWHKRRAQIELVLMRKSIKYSRAVMQQFEKLMALNKTMDVIINDSIHEHHLNHDLADTYSSLTRYIKDKYKYIADLLDKYSDGKDQWAAWIMCIAVVHPEEWPKVDDAFKKAHNGDSLSKFILQKLTTDKVMAEMMALAVDSKFKPTTFTKKPTPAGPPATPLTVLEPASS